MYSSIAMNVVDRGDLTVLDHVRGATTRKGAAIEAEIEELVLAHDRDDENAPARVTSAQQQIATPRRT
jgi:hypothetical protein